MSDTADFLYATVDVAIWSCIETGLSITAGCAATLKPLFKEFLSRSNLFSNSTLRMTSQAWPKDVSGRYQRASSADKRVEDVRHKTNQSITRTFEIQVSRSGEV